MKKNHELNELAQATSTHDEDIVSIILAERKAKQQENTPAETPQTCVITNDTFFTDNNPMGCMSKVDFIQYILDGSSETELKEYQLFIQKLSNGERLNFKPLAYGRSEKKKYYVTFSYVKGEQQYKVPAVGQTDTFLVFYQIGQIICKDLTLQGLREIALN